MKGKKRSSAGFDAYITKHSKMVNPYLEVQSHKNSKHRIRSASPGVMRIREVQKAALANQKSFDPTQNLIISSYKNNHGAVDKPI